MSSMKALSFRVCVLALLLALQAGSGESASALCTRSSLRIGAFNIQIFGQRKMSDQWVAWQIKKIVELYDVLLIQEIRDSSMESVRQLHNMLAPRHFKYVVSKPLGRTRNKEQYAYFYRDDKVLPLDHFVYADPQNVFEREPFVFTFTSRARPNSRRAVSLIGLHAKPCDAISEIGHLRDVIDLTVERMGRGSEPVVLGDLNADCSYANRESRLQARDYLTVSNAFRWLIQENVSTTTRRAIHCAYDRIIIRTSLYSRVVPASAKVFNFMQWLGLNEKQALKISDHFPVEMRLRL